MRDFCPAGSTIRHGMSNHLLIAQSKRALTVVGERSPDIGGTAARSMMNENSADLGLMDVRSLGLDELLSESDDSAFRQALDRLLSPSGDACNGFQSNI